MSEQGKTGLEIRREVMGDAFVERAMGNATAFTQPLQDFVNEHAWGSVWAREALPRKTRSLITLAALTALKCPQELKGHVRGALNNGCIGGGNPRGTAALRGLCRGAGGDRCVPCGAGSDRYLAGRTARLSPGAIPSGMSAAVRPRVDNTDA
ncbi:carboxymuconolactone decarboxylase family protein [Pseudomonas aeruginosa]|nr:carboxymuconolactone decarboxylase family protein [Pseudomonas aeruginosa]